MMMKKARFLIFFTLILAAPFAAGAQGRYIAPHVTQIQAEARNNLVRLTWVDSPDARGPVFIFRSARPFTGMVPAHLRPIVVRHGQQYYIDDIDDMTSIHYFIAASDISGRRFDVILPRTNSASINFIDDTRALSFVEPAVTAEPLHGISNLRAVQYGEHVVITYDVFGPSRNAVIYRSTQPVRQPQDLLNATIVQSRISSPFIDFPVPGISWFYTIVFEDEIALGNVVIRPGVNTTLTPVTIAAGITAEHNLRPKPLPVLSIRNIMPESFFEHIPEQRPLREETVYMLREIQMPPRTPRDLKPPRIFAIDLEAPAGGEDSSLFQILMEYFVESDWENARNGLERFLALPRSKEVEARARFYLGQTFYYTGEYHDALKEFLLFRNYYPEEANRWINTVLAAMVHRTT